MSTLLASNYVARELAEARGVLEQRDREALERTKGETALRKEFRDAREALERAEQESQEQELALRDGIEKTRAKK